MVGGDWETFPHLFRLKEFMNNLIEPGRHEFQEIWDVVHEKGKIVDLNLSGLTHSQKELIFIKFRSVGRLVFKKTVQAMLRLNKKEIYNDKSKNNIKNTEGDS